MQDRVQATSYHVGEARYRSHEGVLDGTFPPLHVDNVGDTIEGHTQVGPYRRSNQQVEDQETGIDLCACDQASASADVCYGHSVHYAIYKPDKLPGPVTFGQIPVTFKKGVGCASLV